MMLEQWWNDDYQGKTEELGEKPAPVSHSFTTNLTRSEPRLKLSLRGEKPASNRLSYGMAETVIQPGFICCFVLKDKLITSSALNVYFH
jgi:hypothetical protein